MKIQNVLAAKGSRVTTLRPEQTLREAARLLAEHNIGALVVVDEGGTQVGILSERDLIRAAARDESFLALTAAAVMTRAVVTGTPQDDVAAVMHTMTQRTAAVRGTCLGFGVQGSHIRPGREGEP